MFDLRLRSTKEQLFAPVGARCPQVISPAMLSVTGLALGVGAGFAAWRGAVALSVALWLFGRIVDGLDGAVARVRGLASDFGGYVDLLLDTLAYVAVPLGIGFAVGETGTWQVIAVVIGAFYVNSVSWLLLSALLEKRALGAAARGEQTSVTMPTGVVEGAETIVLFALALALPRHADVIFGVMAVGVAIGIAQRGIAARRLLR